MSNTVLTGDETPNLGAKTIGPKDDFNKETVNQALRTLDTRVNIVADETQALLEHEADTTSVHGIADTSVLATDSDLSTAVSNHAAVTTSVHGIADTSDLVVTTDTPADGEVLTYTTAGGVNWAAASGGGGGAGGAGSEVVFAASAGVDGFLGPITSWSTVFVTTGATHSSGEITLTDNGIYHITTRAVFYNGGFDYEVITLEHQTGASSPFAVDYAYLNYFGKTTITTSIVRDNSSGTNNTIRVAASAFSGNVTWEPEDVFIVVTKIA